MDNKLMEGLTAFADSLKELMADRALNMNQLSKNIGCVIQAVSNWVNGKYYPRYFMLIKMSDYFDCSIDYILGLSDNKKFELSKKQSNFHERLDLLLKRNKLTKYRLAKLSEIGDSAISKWIISGRIPETATLIAIAKALGCSVDYLLGRTE
ncbi:MAG: helix-turn-helix domain-containing protein [Firmicutes bacterium]|nr:helix-turn-helix domain-containing protein [Bacillota bacterium]